MAADGMMDALLEAAEVAGPQAALASVGVSGGSFGLSNTERLHLEEGTVAGSHRAGGRARAYPDHRGVMVDEDDNIAVDEDVGTTQSNTVAKLKRARAAMQRPIGLRQLQQQSQSHTRTHWFKDECDVEMDMGRGWGWGEGRGTLVP